MAAPTLLSSAFIDVDYFRIITDDDIDSGSNDEKRLIYLINSVTKIFENICGRKLKSRNFSYDSTSDDYDPLYAIFDPPPEKIFWFPTYPVNSLTTLIISDETITASTGYDDDDGYFLYSKTGKLYYSYGFDYGYNQNIKTIWNGGYSSTDDEYAELQYLTYQVVKKLWDGDPTSDDLLSEKLGSYQYTKANPNDLAKFFGLPSFVFYNLFNFKKMVFA